MSEVLTSEAKKFVCNFCDSVFTRKHTMLYHQITAQKCLVLQENKGKLINKKIFLCTNKECKKEFSSRSASKYHIARCLIKNEQNELKLQVKLLQEEMKKINNITTINNTTNNDNRNTVNNITINQWMTEERVLDIFHKNFSTRQLEAKELAQFTMNHLVNGKDRPIYLCTDPSRQRMVFLDCNGNEQVDENCNVLINKVMTAKPYVTELVQDEIIDNTKEEIDRLKPLYKDFTNLHKNRDYKLELSKGLPRTKENARLIIPKPNQDDDIEWDINERLEKERTNNKEETRESLTSKQNEDVFGFFL